MLVACFAFLSMNAQDKKGPQIEFTKLVHDYGTIENGADGTCEFKFKNTGKEDLKISNCRASCGCTIPSWPREAIKKGETGIIKVKYDTKRTGGIHKTITITSNAINTPSTVLTIKGKINPPAPKAPATPKTSVAIQSVKTVPAKPAAPAPQVATADTKTASAAKAKKKSKKRWYQFWKKKNK